MAQNTENKPSRPIIPDISDLLLLTQKHSTLIAENEAKIFENFNIIKDIVHKPFIQTVLEHDSKSMVFPKGLEDAEQYLEMSLSCTLRSIGIAFVLGREYAEHYKENPQAILIAERLDSVAIPTSTQNELKRISEYGVYWIMRLDEMCYFAHYIDKATMIHGLDLHLSQAQTAVFHAFKDGVVNYYDEVFGTNFSKSISYKNVQQNESSFVEDKKGNVASKDTPDKEFDEMSELEKAQFAVDKLLPAMEEAALQELAKREAVQKETMAYVQSAIKERKRNIAIRNAVFVAISLIIIVIILSSLK